MLQAHQWLGIITLAGLAYQYDVGKKLYDGDDSDYWDSHYDKHKAMGYFTYMTYMSTSSLSIFSPPARKYDNNINSIRFHRRMAGANAFDRVSPDTHLPESYVKCFYIKIFFSKYKRL